jgi:hypothetical protein
MSRIRPEYLVAIPLDRVLAADALIYGSSGGPGEENEEDGNRKKDGVTKEEDNDGR